MTSYQAPTGQMIEHARDAIQGVRGALIELYTAIGANPEEPQEVARQFGLNRNLTWKLSRVMTGAQPFATLNHLPGKQGMDLALQAFRKASAPAESVDAVDRALRSLYEVIEVHAGDRDHFELTLESMGLFEREDRPDSGREQAFRGNSMIWGVQAKTRLSVTFIGPSASPDAVDFVGVAALYGFRRLRTSARWRLFRLQLTDDAGKDLPASSMPEEIDQNRRSDDTPLMLRDFCSANMPPLETHDTPEGREYLLPGGPVGNTGVFDCYFGYIARGLSLKRTPGNEYSSAACSISTPVENLVFDVLVHKDLPLLGNPELALYGFPHGGAEDPSKQTEANRLPMSDEWQELVGSPPVVATPLVPRYTPVMNMVFNRMGWTASAFRGLRLTIKYPALSSRYVARWRLG
ncbi:MAG: hypothetical protein GC200_02810 [Tepidisphaera sp.]|nr:hypothetical protein [Tepidisphaera sp.]